MCQIRGYTSQLASRRRSDDGLPALLERVERHARIHFRDVRCPGQREDAVAECIALAWKWYLRLLSRGRDPSRFPSALASFVGRAVRHGRRLAGQERARDVLSSSAQRRHGFTVQSLPASLRRSMADLYASPHGQRAQDAFEEMLHDNLRTPPDEQAGFRLDFRAWRSTRCERDRRLMDDLMVGERPSTVARRFGLTVGRVSQLRRALREDWDQYTAAPA